MILIEPVVLSALGGLCIQLLGLIEINKLPKSRRPDFKDITYWIPYFVNPFLGGLIGYAYFASETDVNRLMAIHIGASAPLLLRTMINSLPASISGMDSTLIIDSTDSISAKS